MEEQPSKALDIAKRGDMNKAEHAMLRWMDKNPTDFETVAAYATRMFEKANYGLAMHLYKYLLNVWLEMPEQYRPIMWAQIGSCLRIEGFDEGATFAFNKAIELDPKCSAAYNGIGICYINQGEPEKVIEWCSKALELEPDQPSALWNRSIGYLEMGRWKEGWAGYAYGERTSHRTYHEDRKTPEWDGKRNRCVVIHGEQGVGDEIMFGTCLPDIVSKCREVILDCHPRLEKTFRRSFPGLTIYPTRKTSQITWPYHHKIDRQIPIGNLPRFFRNDDRDFPGMAYLKADPERVAFYRAKLEAIGPGPYIAIAWFGGEKKTRYDYRSVSLKLWQPLRSIGGTFVSIQYNKWGHRKEAAENKLPEWPGYYDANGPIEDLDEMFALIQACDLVISVCQTAVHMAGAIGKECWCLTPSKPAWRYLTKGERMPWYNSVQLIRQAKDESWEFVIGKVAEKYQVWKNSLFQSPGLRGSEAMESATSQAVPRGMAGSVEEVRTAGEQGGIQ